MTTPSPRAVVIHDIDHARLALTIARRLGRPVTLLSAPAAAMAVGPGFFQALVLAARAEFPDVATSAILDCHTAAGRALAAVRMGFDGLVFSGSHDTLMKLADIAEDRSCTIYDTRPDAYDPLDRPRAETEMEAWLAK